MEFYCNAVITVGPRSRHQPKTKNRSAALDVVDVARWFATWSSGSGNTSISMWSCTKCTFRNASESAFCAVCFHDPHGVVVSQRSSNEQEVIVLLDDADGSNDNDDDGGGKDNCKRPARIICRGSWTNHAPRNGQKKLKTTRTVPMRHQSNGVVVDLTKDSVDVSNVVAQARAVTPMIPFQRTLRQIRQQQRLDEELARALQAMEDEENHVAVAPEATYDVLQWHRQNIHETIKTQAAGIQIVSIEENPHAKVGTTLYNRFVEAWQLVQDQTVELVFHGTAEANVEAICEHGLDPSKRSGQSLGPGEYFAKLAAMSIPYCRMGKKMLVVAVLVDKTGLTANNDNVLVIHKPEHQLPLFVITMA